jgi:hypothetical protein
VVSGSRLRQSDADAILPVSIGTGVWVVLLVGLLVAKPALDAHGTTWWIGAAAVGVVSGVGGLVFLRWRRGRMSRGQDQE